VSATDTAFLRRERRRDRLVLGLYAVAGVVIGAGVVSCLSVAIFGVLTLSRR
jgi:hypothetical protein